MDQLKYQSNKKKQAKTHTIKKQTNTKIKYQSKSDKNYTQINIDN